MSTPSPPPKPADDDDKTVIYVRPADENATVVHNVQATDDDRTVVHVQAADDATAVEKEPVRPEDPTVVAIQLPRRSGSSGHTVELGQLRNQVAKLLDRVHQLEEGADPRAADPRATAAPVDRPPAPPAPRPDPPSPKRPAPAPPGTPGMNPRPGTTTPARPGGGGPSAPARPSPSTPARPGNGGYSAPARPGPSTPPRPGGAPAAPARPGGGPPARPGRAPPPRPNANPATPARSRPPTSRPAAQRPAEAPRSAAKDVAAPASTSAGASASTSAGGDLEAGYAAVLADVLGVPTVASTSNFFDDLGADSMIMARFCAKVRSKPELPNVAIKDIYRAPTIVELAAVGAKAATKAPVSATDTVTMKLADLRKTDVVVVENDPAMAPVHTLTYLLCGFLQLLVLLGYPALIAFVFAIGAEWVLAGTDPLDIYLRALQFTGGMFLGTALLPILAKWILVGRWVPTQFPVFGFRYFRFWLVKTLLRTNPLVRFVGTPIYPIYLRMLGARIGKGTTILSPTVPVCTDMVTIGANSVIRKSSSFTGYRAQSGMIQTGPVRSAPTRWSARRPCSTSSPRSATARSWATPRPCTPGSRCRPASAGTGTRRSRRR